MTETMQLKLTQAQRLKLYDFLAELGGDNKRYEVRITASDGKHLVEINELGERHEAGHGSA